MDFKRKIALAQQSIALISTADDQDMAVRSAALDRLDAFILAEREGMKARVAAKIEAHVAESEPAAG